MRIDIDESRVLVGSGYRVRLDGEDVTDRCQMADDSEGAVRLIIEPPHVGPDGRLATETIFGGAVEIIPPRRRRLAGWIEEIRAKAASGAVFR